MAQEPKKLELAERLILRNQHAIMKGIEDLMFYTRTSMPLLTYQIDQTDDALSKNRVKDD